MSQVRRAYSGAPWEAKVGYCRAVRVGDQVVVTGTVGVDETGKAVSPDPAEQARRAYQIIEKALQEVGAEMRHVVRTRQFVTDVADWEAVGAVHGEVFADHPPATTLIGIAALISPDLKIEIEADAIIYD
jgi:isochorismate pyruvate lyase